MVSEEVATSATDASASSAPPRRALGMLVVMIGVLISAVDGTIVVLALPVIEEDLNISLSAVTWVVVGYLLVVTVRSRPADRARAGRAWSGPGSGAGSARVWCRGRSCTALR